MTGGEIDGNWFYPFSELHATDIFDQNQSTLYRQEQYTWVIPIPIPRTTIIVDTREGSVLTPTNVSLYYYCTIFESFLT